MNRRRTVALLTLLAAVALAGCLGDDSFPAGVDDGPAGSAATTTDNGTETGPNVTQATFVLRASLGTPLYSVSGTDLAHLMPAEHENVTGYVVELSWVTATPNQGVLALWVRGHTRPETTGTVADSMLDPPPLVKVEGPSPLAVALAVEDLVDPDGYSVFVRAAADPVGVNVADLEVSAALSRFEGVPFDPGHRIF